jgi:hypothetical protein
LAIKGGVITRTSRRSSRVIQKIKEVIKGHQKDPVGHHKRVSKIQNKKLKRESKIQNEKVILKG